MEKSSSPVQVIDSHTGGEPTRVVIQGAPDLGGGSVALQAKVWREQHDAFRSAIANEPRGHDAMVGALLVPSLRDDCRCGVIFFNNVGTLNMCIHGCIGVAVTLAYLGKLGVETVGFETPVGRVSVTRHADGSVTVSNVSSYRWRTNVAVRLADGSTVTGDIAWGGNWFFLVDSAAGEVRPDRLSALSHFAMAVKTALREQGICGKDDAEIDHIELFSSAGTDVNADSRNFVWCPGHAYDRSPCGTGTSAKLACLAAAGKLRVGERWRQAGILGSIFTGKFDWDVNSAHPLAILPHITGQAWITGRSEYVFDASDPFCHGINSLLPE